jgi:predicted RNA-binding protein associated with RNAse of E/G family
MGNVPKRYKKKLFPPAIIDISSDILYFFNKELMVTGWAPEVDDPTEGVASVISFIFLEKGFQISKKFDKNNTFLYWYCDIIDVESDQENNIYTITDLVVDVVVYPDNYVRIIDLDELANLIEQDGLDKKLLLKALRNLDNLLLEIDRKNFPPKEVLEHYPEIIQ